ncbi:L,D-transpeptidase family protein [Luteibacter aegosomatissinici]|uniref:L,D-transpeptidase family protein n=1 Tax=Luteibacter aegosomatissinici TaxID=2911539 RepID=UPI001FFBD5D5|nr:L,D-transpeptidase family protein [Luteibacter aegosomatissinici]UPG92504.1 L,D-transpeptidase family protein [Luteibacter aegosomatissinici]
MTMEKRHPGMLAVLLMGAALPLCGNAQTPPAPTSAANPPPIVAPAPGSSASVTVPQPPAPDDAVAQAIYARILAMAPLQGGPLSRQDAAIGQALADFYTQRHYAPAWADGDNVDQLFAGLAGMEGDGLLPQDYGLDALRNIWQAPGFKDASPAQHADFDLTATRAYMTALVQLARGKVDPTRLDPVWNIDPVAIDPQQGLAMIEGSINEHTVAQAFAMARPQNPLYAQLRDGLAQLRATAANGDWPTVPDGPSLKPGMNDPRVSALRARLVAGGYLDASLEHGQHYDTAVTDAVKRFQGDQFLDVDGAVGADTLAALNVSITQRIGQVRANMERARWLLHALPGTFVVVDVAGFRVTYYRDGNPIWKSRVQVGKPYRSTPIFRSDITYITFNPTWTIPPTILKNDVIPKIRANPSYLANNRIRVLDSAGNAISPASVNWSRPGGVTLRQDAGPGNSLGQVVIRFPNSFAVYLHDTPHQELFSKAKRDTSSGCIRVEHPLDLVQLLFNDDEKWNRHAIDERIATGKTQNVTLPTKVPILLAYWTVDIDDTGKLAYKNDIYGRDAPLLAALNKPQLLKTL